jgi:hypothetical protein
VKIADKCEKGEKKECDRGDDARREGRVAFHYRFPVGRLETRCKDMVSRLKLPTIFRAFDTAEVDRYGNGTGDTGVKMKKIEHIITLSFITIAQIL